METGDGSDKAEAEPVAWSAATLFQPIKTLEDVLAFIDGDSRSIIGDRNDGTAIVLSDLHGHPTGFTARRESMMAAFICDCAIAAAIG
jgi:hypothetical protein